MNKAFVRELDREEPRCPVPTGCGAEGLPVSRTTKRAILGESLVGRLSDDLRYCPNPVCPVVYFEPWTAEVVLAAELPIAVWPKSPEAPLCACFSVFESEVCEDGRAGRKDRIRTWIQRAESDEAHCADCTASGRSCAKDLRRIFLQELGGPPA